MSMPLWMTAWLWLEGSPPLFSTAAIGDTFIKIGVGLLQKTTDQYSFQEHYPFVQAGAWDIQTSPGCIQLKAGQNRHTIIVEY